MFLRFDLNRICLTFGPLLITYVPSGAYPTFIDIKKENKSLILTLSFLALYCFPYCHVSGRTYEHAGIFVEIKLILIFACAIAYHWVQSCHQFKTVVLIV